MNDSAWMKEMKGKSIIIIILMLLTSLSYMPISIGKTRQIVTLSPLDNIQNSIESLDPLSIIILTKGIYNQSFTLFKEMTIIGEDPLETIINATTEKNKPAITIANPYVNLSNITIKNNGPGLYTTGIRIIDENTTIHNCIFKNTPIGISIWSNNNTIQKSTFINCSDEGIVLLSTSFSTANNNKIIQCLFKQNCDAIELQRSSNNLIQDCIMVNNSHSGIDAIDKDNNMNIIKNCTIENNAVHGIYFSHSNENQIISCKFKGNIDGDVVTPNSNNISVINATKSLPSISDKIIYEISVEKEIESKEYQKTQTITIMSQILQSIKQFFQLFTEI